MGKKLLAKIVNGVKQPTVFVRLNALLNEAAARRSNSLTSHTYQ